MSENIGISVKILKLKEKLAENGKNYAVYEVAPFDYGGHSYLRIKIEYQEESDLQEFVENKKFNIIADVISGDGLTLIIGGGTWNSDRTVWQKIKDTAQETTDKVGDASAAAVKKTGEKLEKAGKNLEKSADEDKWPRWVLPVVIILGIILLIVIFTWIFKPKRR